jgi:hypothetical protein
VNERRSHSASLQPPDPGLLQQLLRLAHDRLDRIGRIQLAVAFSDCPDDGGAHGRGDGDEVQEVADQLDRLLAQD